jgi:Tetratricopeptide repeat
MLQTITHTHLRSATAPLRATAAAIALGAVLTASAALASGGGGGGGGGAAGHAGGSTGMSGAGAGTQGGAQTPTDLTTCNTGMVWDREHKKCITQHSGALPDPAETEYAYALAKAGRYQEAIATLDLLQDPNTPRALNYRGYATRKLGRTDEGISYYLKSVALDPHYAQVREYLGEAYVIQGKIDLAKDQLTTIKTICGTTKCEEYEDLAAAIGKAANL